MDAADALHQGATLGDLFVRAVRRFPDREALVAGDTRWTYAQLGDRVARMGAVLRRAGLGPGKSLAILSRNTADVLVVFFAAVVEGLRLTPLAAMASAADQAFILADAEIDVLVIDPAFADRLETFKDQAPSLTSVFSLGPTAAAQDLTQLTEREPEAELRAAPPASDVTMIYYTGGTTGRPKGVVHTHASAMATVLMASAEWEWPSEVRFLATTPVSHAAGAFAWPTMLKGGSVHVLPGFDARQFADYVRRERITAAFLVPTAIHRLVEEPSVEPSDLATLETVVYGAAPISLPLISKALRRFGPIFMQLYGQTEAPNLITYLERAGHCLDDPESLSSCGIPVGPVQVALLDDDCRPVGPGAAGEICVRGVFVMKGYWKRPDETAKAFEGGWLHTGDVGRFDASGRLHIVDRKKDMIITGGFNVYPSEVEAVICEHPSVAACAVVGAPDPTWGEAVTALVVPREGHAIDVELLQARVRERKGAVHTPKAILVRDSLPLTAVGKVDKRAIRASLGGA